jgi:hypothetical protein
MKQQQMSVNDLVSEHWRCAISIKLHFGPSLFRMMGEREGGGGQGGMGEVTVRQLKFLPT